MNSWSFGSLGSQGLAYLAYHHFAGKGLLQKKRFFEKSAITFTLFKITGHVDDL